MWGVGAGLIHIYGDAGSGIPAVGASGAICWNFRCILVMFPRAKVMTFVMLGIFLENDAHPCKILLTILVNLQNLLPFFIGGFGVAGGGVAFLAHIGGFFLGLGIGFLYKKTHRSDFSYGTRYGYKGRLEIIQIN